MKSCGVSQARLRESSLRIGYELKLSLGFYEIQDPERQDKPPFLINPMPNPPVANASLEKRIFT